MMLEERIRSYIVENFLLGQEGGGLTSTESLLQSGVVDSTGVLELVAFLEDEFDIQVADEDLVPENLDSISNIAAFVHGKLDGRAPGTARAE